MKNLLTIFALLLIGFTSCKQEANNQPKVKTIHSDDTSSKSDNNNHLLDSKINDIKGEHTIKKSDGSLVGGFDLQPLTIYTPNAKFTSKTRTDKTKYYNKGELKYEVKYKEDGLKLRDKNSNLLWKVKIYPHKIKVSNNEENLNPYEIRTNDGVITIQKNDLSKYSVRIEEDKIFINDKESFELTNGEQNYVYGIMAIEEIPEEHRLFLLAELLKRI